MDYFMFWLTAVNKTASQWRVSEILITHPVAIVTLRDTEPTATTANTNPMRSNFIFY
jgi:hypothetical protein